MSKADKIKPAKNYSLDSLPKEFLHPKYWPIWVGIAFIRLLAFMPYPLVMSIAKGFGLVAFHLAKSRKKVVDINLAACFPEKSQSEREQMAKETMINTGIGVVEGLYSWWAPKKVLLDRSTFHNMDLIEKAQAEGKGVIFLCAHFTTLEIGGRIAGEYLPLDVTYRKVDNPLINWFVERSRAKHHNELINKDEMRKMVRCLKKGHVVFYAGDQDFGRKYSIFAPFFGIQASTIATFSRIIKMSKPKVLMVNYYRDDSQGLGRAHYHIEISDPFEDNFGEDDYETAVAMNNEVERIVRQTPNQYFWVHKRFKRRPNPSDKPFYS